MQDSNLRRRSQRIYSPPPLPLGTISRNHFSPDRLGTARLMAIGVGPVNGWRRSKLAARNRNSKMPVLRHVP
jgi:hypothetical protein